MATFEQIFIANSVYAEFLYLLRFPDKVNKTLFLIGPSCVGIDVPNRVPIIGPKDMRNLPVLQENLAQQAYLLLQGRKVPCYGNVETIYSPFFVRNFPFYPVTDGLWGIQKFPAYLKENRFSKCYAVRYPGGLDIQDDRMEYMDIPALWKGLSKAERKTLVGRFGISPDEFAGLKKKKILLVTQPLSEDSIVSEEEKIRLYRSIVSRYFLSDIVIKPHPRERTNWAEVFPTIPVVPRIVPAELLSLMTPQIERIATFFSTSACTVLPPERVDFYAKDFTKLRMMDEGRHDGDKPLKPAASFDVEESLKENNFNWLRVPDNSFYKDK